MQSWRSQEGFSLIEIAVVLGMIVLMVAMAVPNLIAYQRRQQARGHTQRIANALGQARALAIHEGNPFMVIFDASGRIRIVDDQDGDFAIDAGETTKNIDPPAGTSVTYYGDLASPPAAVEVPEDGGGAIPSSGTSFPVDATLTVPAIAFTRDGLPVSLLGGPPNGGGVGSGAGSYYVTDNDEVVYAATLLPLGGTRLRVYRPSLSDWY